jgi:XTP/dITP diphosphohydrolase
MRAYFVTGNKSKFSEAQAILKPSGVSLVQSDIKIIEPSMASQEEVVLEKARQAFENLKKPVIVDDTCIYFDAYKNFPGTLTKDLIDRIGFVGIKRLLNGLRKGVHFQTMVCYNDGKECKVFSGRWKGRIINIASKKVNPEWTYNSIFIPDGFNIPLSEIPMEERVKHSHRKKALLKMMRWMR